MKKILCLFVLVFSMIGLCSCDKGNDNPTNSDVNDNNTDNNQDNNNQDNTDQGGNNNQDNTDQGGNNNQGNTDNGGNNNQGNTNQGGGTQDTPITLNAPLDVTFDEKTGMLSWSSVALSTGYIVNHDGNEFTVSKNETYLPIDSKVTNIKVKATSGEITSDWSEVLSYEVNENDEFNNIKLFLINELKEGTELLEILSYNTSSSETNNNTLLIFVCKVKLEGQIKIVRLLFTIPRYQRDMSILEAINSVDKSLNIDYEVFDIVEYDTLGEIYDKDLAKPYDRYESMGYTVEHLKTYVTKLRIYEGKARIRIFSIAKLQSGSDIKYSCYQPTISSELAEGSLSYIENLPSAKISSSFATLSNDFTERMLYEADNNITAFGKNTSIKDEDITRYDKADAPLEQPKDLSFDYQTGMLSWRNVATATSYVVSHNGNEFVVSDNEAYLPIDSKTTKIKVRAASANNLSAWSNEITYDLNVNDEFNNLKLFVLDELKEGAELLEIFSYSLSYASGSDMSSLVIPCKVKLEGKIKLIRLLFRAPKDCRNLPLQDVISSIDKSLDMSYEIYDIVEYDTLKELYDKKIADPFEGNVNRGFEVEYMNSYVTNFKVNNGKAQFYLFSVAKLTNPNMTEYYCYNPTIKTEVGEGSLSYIENLSNSSISLGTSLLKNELIERMMYEGNNEITAFGKNTAITDDMIDRWDQDINILRKPTGLRYTQESNKLYWNYMGFAKGFIVSVNGREFTTANNEFNLPILADEMTIKVKSFNDSYTSDWSDEYSVKIESTNTWARIKLLAMETIEANTQILELVSYEAFSDEFNIVCKVKIDDKIKLVNLTYKLTKRVPSFSNDVLDSIDDTQKVKYEVYDIVEYDSLAAAEAVGPLFEEEKANGNKIEYLKTYTTNYEVSGYDAVFYIYSLVKISDEYYTSYNLLLLAVKSTPGEGSLPYVENVKNYSTKQTVLEAQLINNFEYEDEYDFSTFGKNTTITDDEIIKCYVKLDKPQNLKYDHKTGVLSWDKVDNATSYNVYVNGTGSTVTTNSMNLEAADKMTIKVRAKSQTLYSEWSDYLEFEIPTSEEFNELKEFVVNELKEGTELLEIISYKLSYSNASDVTTFIIICKAKLENTAKLIRLVYNMPGDGRNSTISQVIDSIDRTLNIDYEIYDLVEYDSLGEIYDKELAEPYKSQISNGYTVEHLKTYVTRYRVYNGKARFYIFSIVKLQNGNDIKYSIYHPTIMSDIAEGSLSYIENLSTAKITEASATMNNDIVIRMLYEAENGFTAMGKNTTITDDMIDRYDQDINILRKPSTLRFNDVSNTLTWNSFGLATGYTISVNDVEYTSTENSFVIPVVSDEMTIKVKAYNDLYETEWSDVLSYVKRTE